MINYKILFFLFTICIVANLYADFDDMKLYTINLPEHVLKFSFPEEIAKKTTSKRIEKEFSYEDSAFNKDGFREIGGALYDIGGNFFTEPKGSLKFFIFVQKKRDSYVGKIDDLNEFLNYIIWFSQGRGMFCKESIISNQKCILRGYNHFIEGSNTRKEDLEIFSLNINSDVFIDFGFNIIEWNSNNTSNWMSDAKLLKEKIKSSINLIKK